MRRRLVAAFRLFAARLVAQRLSRQNQTAIARAPQSVLFTRVHNA